MFRNLDLPDKKGDIDIALVGPGGIFALEVKTYTGNLSVENGRYYKETRSGHMARIRRGAGAQARSNGRRLCNYLKSRGIVRASFVEPVVVLAKGVPIQVVRTATIIWTSENIDSRLAELRSRISLSPDQVDRIVKALEGTVPGSIGKVH
jgi:hypothetical protein